MGHLPAFPPPSPPPPKSEALPPSQNVLLCVCCVCVCVCVRTCVCVSISLSGHVNEKLFSLSFCFSEHGSEDWSPKTFFFLGGGGVVIISPPPPQIHVHTHTLFFFYYVAAKYKITQYTDYNLQNQMWLLDWDQHFGHWIGLHIVTVFMKWWHCAH